VTGYKVRVGDGPWFSASQLAADLTLSKLRPRWAGNEDDTSRAAALAIWREEVQLPASVPPAVVSTNLDTAEDALARWAEQLRGTDPQDKTTWRQAAVEAAGVVSSLSRDPGADGEVLAGAGQTLSRQALAVVDPAGVHRQQPDEEQAGVPRPSFGPSPAQLAARHVQLAMRAGGTSAHPGWIAVLQQLRQVLAAIEAAQRGRRELVAAGQLAGAQQALGRVEDAAHARYGRRDLDELREAWQAREASRVSTRGADHHPAADGTTAASRQARAYGLDGSQQNRSRGR